MFKTIEWTDDGVRMIDQTRAADARRSTSPAARTWRWAEAIRSMVIRGAPAIGVAAAMGVALGVKDSGARTIPELPQGFRNHS